MLLVGASPCVSTFGAAYEIGWCLICRSCLHGPPVSFCPAAFIAGYCCSRQSHIFPVGYYHFHFRIGFPFHMILLFNIIISQWFFISTSTFNLAILWHQHRTAIRTEFHIIKHHLKLISIGLTVANFKIQASEFIQSNWNVKISSKPILKILKCTFIPHDKRVYFTCQSWY